LLRPGACRGLSVGRVGDLAFLVVLAWPGLASAQWEVMPLLQHLLQRWGFVKLDRYGLELAPDGRVLSMRPAVLDDGVGRPVVGWQDSDPAMMELQPWPAQPSPLRAMASRVAMPPDAAPAKLLLGPAIPVASEGVPGADATSAAVMAVEVAPEPRVDEDDWEWTIALARARVATDEVEAAAAAGPPPPPRPTQIRTRPMAAVAVKDASGSSAAWPKTEPIGAIDYDSASRVTTTPVVAIPRTTPAASQPRPPAPLPRVAAPGTVIPVPTLPAMQHPGGAKRLAPVVRTTSAQAAQASPHRFAQGTGPVDPTATAPMSDDTQPNLSVGDRTTPGIALPMFARAVQLPSVKRRTTPR
jgi:hypothetical protein